MVKRTRRNERGSSLIELALVISVFVLIVFSALDLGYAYVVKENMTHAAQEGLRVALVSPGTPAQQGQAAMTAARQRLSTYTATSLPQGTMVQGGSYGQCDQNGTTGGGLDVCTNISLVGSSSYAPCPNGQPGLCLTLTIGYDYVDNSIVHLPWVDAFIPSQIHVTATQRMG